MCSTRLQPSSTNWRLLSDKLPIMHVIGNSGDGVSWSENCVKTDTVPCLLKFSGVLQGSLMFMCENALPARSPEWSGAGGEKKEISKLEGKRKKGYENPNFPTTSKNEFKKSTAFLKHLPSHHPKCVYRFLWFLNTHAPKLSERCVGFGFFEAIGLQRYVEGSVVR